MKRISLNGDWAGVCAENQSIRFAGNVPGCVLHDLITNGFACKDVFYRDNAESVQKYENYGWNYRKSFLVDTIEPDTFLIFERLDTYCDVFLNEILLGYCDNGFIPHKFLIDGVLKQGKNTIEVRFYSPIKMVEGKPLRKGAFTTERMYTRRTQCTYGWDWNMRFVTCGICGDVYLQIKNDDFTVRDVYIYTEHIDSDSAQVDAEIRFEKVCGGMLCFEVFDSDRKLVKRVSRYCDERFVVLNFDFEEPKLWYPYGYGSQHLYQFVIRTQNEEIYRQSFGIRTVCVTQLIDDEGSSAYHKCMELKQSDFAKEYDENNSFSCFILKVNGIRMMCKGANWVPCQPFKTGDEDEKITSLLELAQAAGINMLRVWGGGAFESEHFYDECTRLGIMVTQDFLMACGSYPEEEEWFVEQLKAEAEYASMFLRNKPCLMWWSGDNENAIEGRETDKNYPGRIAACHAIGPIVHKNDPRRRFFASSPYGGAKYGSNTVGTTHNTQFLENIFAFFEAENVSDYKEFFKAFRARFIAEEPAMGAIQTGSMKKFLRSSDIFGEDLSMMKYHTKTNPFLKRTLFEYTYDFAEKLLGKFLNGEDRCFKMKYIQYEWIRVTLEQARREKWFCSGIVYWMFNDCWPAASGWALIDYYCVPKASYYSFRRCAAAVVCSVDMQNGMYQIYGCNDTTNPVLCKMAVRRFNRFTQEYTIEEYEACLDENVSQRIASLPVFDNEFLVVTLSYDGGSDVAFYQQGGLKLRKVDVRYTVGNGEIIVMADQYIHALGIDGDMIAEDNYFIMLPGETRRIAYSGDGEISIAAYGLEPQ